MAFKEVRGNGGNINQFWPKKASERKEGDSVEGFYKGKVERPGFNGGTDTLYLLETKEGETVGVNATASISRKMEMIPTETMVKIVFNGKKTSPKSGRQYNDFSVFIDEDMKPSTNEVDFDGIDF